MIVNLIVWFINISLCDPETQISDEVKLSTCRYHTKIFQIYITSFAISVGIGLVWDSDRPSVDHIMDVISCLGTTLRLPDVSNNSLDPSVDHS